MNRERLLTTTVSLAVFLGIWFCAALLTDDPQVLPRPTELFAPAIAEFRSGDLLFHLGTTLRRVVFSFFLAMTLGTVIGYLLGRRDRFNRWFDPWLVIFLNLPALVTIVLCYLWVGLNETAAVLAVTVNKIPSIAIVVREGARALAPEFDAMAKVYRMNTAARLWHILIPQLAPFLAAAARSGLATLWKIVLVVEFLGRSDGIGFQIHLYFQLFDVSLVLVYALTFIAVMLTIELVLLQPWERRVHKWRRT